MSDPIEVVMEEALRPGRYVSEHASFSLSTSSNRPPHGSPRPTLSAPSGCYETFIAACHEKGEEGDGQSI